jgi:uncharacterized protein YdbL (DUF1318 family)
MSRARVDRLSLPNRTELAPYRNLPTNNVKSELKSHQVQYLKRKATGRCTATGCPDKAELAHTHCRKHLRRMAKQHKTRYQSRAKEAVCIYCGERPQFWGVRCLICRQRFAKNRLPSGALRALRAYRAAEHQRDLELAQVEARFAARKLLIVGDVTGASAEALRLHMGIDDGRSLTYEQVAKRMGISKQRVGQLLQLAKAKLTAILQCEAPPPRELMTQRPKRPQPPQGSRHKPERFNRPRAARPGVQMDLSSR